MGRGTTAMDTDPKRLMFCKQKISESGIKINKLSYVFYRIELHFQFSSFLIPSPMKTQRQMVKGSRTRSNSMWNTYQKCTIRISSVYTYDMILHTNCRTNPHTIGCSQKKRKLYFPEEEWKMMFPEKCNCAEFKISAD